MTGDVSGDLTGRQLGNYRIDGVLGKGGMSVMYKATDVRLGRKVALKVIGDHLGADAEFRERFVDEARNTSALDHANIVPLYDFGELDGMLYIAMRLVDGSDLASLIGAGPLAPERALRLLEQVGDALDTLHAKGLVHLDVKPANVLVTSRESVHEHVYVADFGLTRRGATGHRTRGGDFLGSPTYAAPEHLRGEPLDGRTDQYALVCVFYACLTGNPPYRGDVSTVIKGHLGGEPAPVSRVVGLPGAIDEVIGKGMAKNPADRYPSCVEFMAAARTALAADRPQAPVVAPGPAGRGAAPAQGHPGESPPPPQTPPAGFGGPPPSQGPPPGQAQPGQPPPPQAQPYGQAPGPPPGLGSPPRGMPPAGPAQPPGYAPPPQGDPARVRPPVPVRSSVFVEHKRGRRWIAPVIVGVVLIGVVIGLLLLFTSGDEGQGGGQRPEQTNQPAPDIPVGPGQSGPSQPSSGQGEPPPSSIPVVPQPGG